MEHYDSLKAQQVWSRVRGESEKNTPPLPKLLLAEMQLSADLGRLLHRFPETKGLLAHCRKNIACLRGILFLTDSSRPVPVLPKPQDSSAETLLRKCIGQQLQAAADYTSLADHPEYGCIFTRLAEQKRQQCQVLLEMLGRDTEKQGRRNG